MLEIDGLPGESVVRQGLVDLERGALSPAALTLAVASGRLRALGIRLPDTVALPAEREIALYTALQRSGTADPFQRYNALLRELGSFLEAAEGRRRRSA